MTTFGLIHGAWHGAWCWERLVGPLAERGHRAIAVDLPIEEPEAGLDPCADLVAASLAIADDDVVVVGHSLHGLVAPLVAARRPVAAVVYLCAFIPVEGMSMDDQFRAAEEPILIFSERPERDGHDRSRWGDEEVARRALHPDLAPEDAANAFAQLRPQEPTTQREICPPLPPVPAVSIIGARDAAVNPEWSRRVARERLGADPVELDAGHFPMITAPEALAAALANVGH